MLLDETGIAAAEHYDNLQINASQTGLRINKDKTKIMHINYPKEVTPPKALEGLKVVEDFKYLGARKAFVNKEEFLGVSFGNYKPFADLIAYPDT